MRFAFITSSLLFLSCSSASPTYGRERTSFSQLSRRDIPYYRSHALSIRDKLGIPKLVLRSPGSPFEQYTGGNKATPGGQGRAGPARANRAPSPQRENSGSNVHGTSHFLSASSRQDSDQALRAAAEEAERHRHRSRPSSPIRDGIRQAFSEELDMSHVGRPPAGNHPLMPPIPPIGTTTPVSVLHPPASSRSGSETTSPALSRASTPGHGPSR